MLSRPGGIYRKRNNEHFKSGLFIKNGKEGKQVRFQSERKWWRDGWNKGHISDWVRPNDLDYALWSLLFVADSRAVGHAQQARLQQ